MPKGVFAALTPADIPVPVKVRFVRNAMAASNFVADADCWEWPKSCGSHGYGQVGWGGKDARRLVLAHRMSYLIFLGPIPEGMTVDHLCRNRRCINPAHLRLLTNLENARANGMSARTHCPHGHPYNEENTYFDPKGHRYCRECSRARKRVA